MNVKLFALVKRDFLALVQRKAFIISTLLMPVFMAVVFILPTYLASKDTKRIELAVSDQTQTMKKSLTLAFSEIKLDNGGEKYDLRFIGHQETDIEAAKEQILEKKLGGLLILPEQLLADNNAQLFLRSLTQLTLQKDIRNVVTGHLRQQRMIDSGIDIALVSKVMASVNMQTESVLTGKGNAKALFISALIIVMILYMTLLLYGNQIMNSVVEDKTSKVYEVLQSCASAREILMGKVLGVGGAALTQYVLWGGSFLFLKSQFEIPMLAAVSFKQSFVFQILPLFFLGYLIYAQLYATVGAMCRTLQEASQMAAPLLMFLMLPIIMIGPIAQDPDGMLATALSVFPMTAALIMPLRLGATSPELWQVASCYLLLFGTVIGVYFLSGKLFEMAIMHHGKRPGFKTMMAWMRGSGI